MFLPICDLSSFICIVFCRAEVFNLMKSSLSVTFHGSCLLTMLSKCHHHTQSHLVFYIAFWNFYSFCVWHLGLWSVLSWFLWRVWILCLDSLFPCGCPAVQHHLLKRLSSPHCVAFAPLSAVSWLCLCGSASALSSVDSFCSFAGTTLSW